jgi:hypothetical protein
VWYSLSVTSNVPQTRRRRALRFAALGLGIGVLVAAGAALAVTAAFPPERLTPLLRAQLSRHLDAPVSLGRAEIRLFPVLFVQLENVGIGDPNGYRRPAAWPRGGLATARRAEGSLALLPLLSRRIEIVSLRLTDAAVTAVRNGQGVGNWEGLGGPHASEPTPGADAFDLAVRRFDLERASVRIYDARDGMYLATRQVDLSLALDRRAGGRAERLRLEATLRGLGGRTAWPIGERPIRLEADIEHGREGERWRVRRAALHRGRLTLSASGTIEGQERVVDLALEQSELPLEDLLELLPRDQVESLGRLEGTGRIRLAARARGPASRGRVPAVRARATLDGGRLAFRDKALALEGLGFDLSANEHGADLARLSGRVGRSTFDVSGVSRGWADPRVRGRVRAAADLADLSRFLPVADSTRLSGLARVDVSGAGRPASGDGADFGWSGRVDLTGVSASGVGLGRPLEDVAGTIGLAPGRAWAKGLTAKVGRSDFTLDGTIERPIEWFASASGAAKGAPPGAVARVSVRSRRLDLDQLLPTGPSTTPLPPVRAEGTFEVASLHWRKLDATRARGRFTYASGVTAIDECALEAYGGSATGRAWIDFRDRARPHYRLDATAQDLDANAVVSAWTEARNVAFGTLRMSIDLDGTGLTGPEVARGLRMTGLAQVLGGRLAGARVFARLAEFTGVDRFRILAFRDLSAPFRVVSGRVVFDPLALSSDEVDWLARGSVGLDGTLDFAIAAVVPPELVPGLPQKLLGGAGSKRGGDGRLTVDLGLGGTVRSPALSWDANRTASRLLESTGLALIDRLAERLGGSLGDSLARSASVEAAADRVVAQAQERMEDELEQRREELEAKAVEELTRLFERKAPPPPPPASPPDSASTDATSTAPPESAPPPPPMPLPDSTPSIPAPAPVDTSRSAPDSGTG